MHFKQKNNNLKAIIIITFYTHNDIFKCSLFSAKMNSVYNVLLLA